MFVVRVSPAVGPASATRLPVGEKKLAPDFVPDDIAEDFFGRKDEKTWITSNMDLDSTNIYLKRHWLYIFRQTAHYIWTNHTYNNFSPSNSFASPINCRKAVLGVFELLSAWT